MAQPERLKQSRLAEYDAGGFAMVDPARIISGAVTLSFYSCRKPDRSEPDQQRPLAN
jgi:hypothetical protein